MYVKPIKDDFRIVCYPNRVFRIVLWDKKQPFYRAHMSCRKTHVFHTNRTKMNSNVERRFIYDKKVLMHNALTGFFRPCRK